MAGDREKYLPIDKESGDEIKVVKLLREYGGLKKNEFFHVTESDLRKDLERAPEDRLFGPAKLTGNQIAENLLLSEEVRKKMKDQSKLGDEMNRAEPVIDLIYEVKKEIRNLPRIEVRIGEARDHNVLGVAKLSRNQIWITDRVLNMSEDALRNVVFHEIVHAVTGFGHDEKCPLMKSTMDGYLLNKNECMTKLKEYIKPATECAMAS